jgi:hypothetical protein
MITLRPASVCTLALVASLAACMDPLYDYSECQAIEHARCDLRGECNPGFDVDTCRAYYDEFCRTRQLKGPGNETLTDAELQACLDAIAAFPCDQLNSGVDETESLPECTFIEAVDGGASGDDAGPDAG